MPKKLCYGLLLLLIVAFSAHPLRAQVPKVVVVIVLDQFPYDYIERFQPYFVKGGFNYLLTHGASFANARYEHASNKTGPGHAALATGSYGHRNGIPANSWYDRQRRKVVNCVGDDSVKMIGDNYPGRSPRNLVGFTFGDMLRIGTNFRSKVIAISNKDRAAVLLAGKFGTAYWLEDSLAITSSYYMQRLPGYLDEVNSSGIFRKYFGVKWTELKPDLAAQICDADDAPYEANWLHLGRTFPHVVTGDSTSKITSSFFYALDHTPFATKILLDVGKKIFVAESLGRRGVTDILCIGISVTDIIGHDYGPQSHEVFDNVLRTDRLLADFFSFLDHSIGLSNCLIALSSDHGIAPIPEYLKLHSPNVPAGRVSSRSISSIAERALSGKFGPAPAGAKWIEQVVESDVYINRQLLAGSGIAVDSATRVLKDSLPAQLPIAVVCTRGEILSGSGDRSFGQMVEKSFYPSRSGDVSIVLKPFYIMSGDSVGTNHGQPYSYDSHVPLIIAGKNIKSGTYFDEVSPIDLAPTIDAILHVEFPPSSEGKILKEVIGSTR